MALKHPNQYFSPKIKCHSYAWCRNIEKIIENHIKGESINLCSGRSKLGDIRLDIGMWENTRKLKNNLTYNNKVLKRNNYHIPNMLGDAGKIPFKNNSFDTVIADPIYDNFQPPFIDEMVRVCKSNGLFIYYYPIIPLHNALDLQNIYLYKNQGKKYNRILSIHQVCKLTMNSFN